MSNTWNGGPVVQSDGLAINTPTTKTTTNLESAQFYVIKDGQIEVSTRFTIREQAVSQLQRMLVEAVSRQNGLRIAVVDSSGRELLGG